MRLLGGLRPRKGGGWQTGYIVYGADGLCPPLLSRPGGYRELVLERKEWTGNWSTPTALNT